MKFPTFGDRDVSVETGEIANNGLDTQEKKILNFRWNLQKKRKRWGKSRQMFFVDFFLGGGRSLKFLLCCYDRILIQISQFLRCIFHVFVAFR